MKNTQKSHVFLLASVLAALLMSSVSFLAPKVSAAGEKYEWINNRTIQASGGNYKSPVNYYKNSSDNTFNSVNSASIMPFEDKSGCTIAYFQLTVSGDKKTAVLAFQPDVLIGLGSSSPCSQDIIDSYTKNISLDKPGNAGTAAPETPDTKRLLILAVVPDGKAYPRSSDTITLFKNNKKIKTIDGEPYGSKEGYSGEKGFKALFENINPGDGYKACSKALDKCIEFKKEKSDVFLDDTHKIVGKGVEPADPNTTCESESGPLSWAFCPLLRLIDGTISVLDQTVNNLLFINQSTYDNSGVNKAWAIMRNLALLLLVPMMIFMVIGTALNFGPFDPYTVKKALPRMFIATIFIVVSLPVTKFGVELSNMVGQGLGNLIVNASPQNVDSLEAVFASSNSSTSGEGLLFTGAVTGLIVGGLTGTVTIGILFSFALVTLVALLIGFVILVMRQVLLIMLMVVAPIAILVWIFPGNDKLWGVWKTTLIAMLMMYPIISMLLASGRFVAGIVSF